MLSRYQIVRGVPASALPQGVRQDTRAHTRHAVHPDKAQVNAYLEAPTPAKWQRFAERYRRELSRRFKDDRGPFDAIAELARHEDVYFGCNCPTAKNPSLRHCHTWLALEFFQAHYRGLDVRLPREPTASARSRP